MPRYIVRIPEVHVNKVEVEAESFTEALDKAEDLLAEGLDDLNLEYSHTLEIWDWTAEEVRSG